MCVGLESKPISPYWWTLVPSVARAFPAHYSILKKVKGCMVPVLRYFGLSISRWVIIPINYFKRFLCNTGSKYISK